MKTAMMMKMFSLAAVLSLCGATQVHAMKLVGVKVEVDKKVVYESYYEHVSNTPVGEEWRLLSREPDVSSKVIDLTIDPAHPLRLTLKGDIILRVSDSFVHLNELTLKRDSTASTKWYLPKEELDRAAAKANINMTPSSQLNGGVIVRIVLGVVVLTGLGLCLIYRKKSHSV